MNFPWKKRRSKQQPRSELIVEIVTRDDVASPYVCTADSDLTLGMFAGSLQKFVLADVVILRDGEKLTILKCRSADDVIARIRG